MSEHKRIFLGHAGEDKPQVMELYHALKARGFSPWLDAVDLIPGQLWRQEIPKAIRSSEIFLACLSKSSIAKKGYVQEELRHALAVYAEQPPNAIYLIPVRLDDCEIPDLDLPRLGLHLRDLHWVDLFEPDGIEQLLRAIEHKIGAGHDMREDKPGGARSFASLKFNSGSFASRSKPKFAVKGGMSSTGLGTVLKWVGYGFLGLFILNIISECMAPTPLFVPIYPMF